MGLLKTLTINGTTYEVVPVVPTSSVTLNANSWTGNGDMYSQVVVIPGVTSCTKVDLQPTSEQLAEFHYKVLAFVAENEGGIITVYAIGDKPTDDHTIQVTLTEVAASDKIRGNTVGTSMPRSNVEQTDPRRADYVEGVEKLVKSINGITPDASGNVSGSIVCTTSGASILVNDASDGFLQGLRIFGKTTQETTPTPTAPVDFNTAATSGSITVSVEENGQSVTIDTPDGMRGIPVQVASTKSNFTDATGQKWFTDEVDLARGVYVQRCYTVTFDGTEPWFLAGDVTPSIGSVEFSPLAGLDTATNTAENGNCAYHMCSHFRSVPRNGSRPDGTVNAYGSTHGITLQFKADAYGGDLDGWKSYLAAQAAAGTPVTMLLGMKTQVEMELPEEVKVAFAALHTNKGDTTITNTGGANMEVSYVADTKLYIDNKFNALASAIVNNT